MLKYQEVALAIKNMIYQNKLTMGTQLANIEELIKQYQVSRSTIIKALDRLERHGIIYQIQGSGIFVRQRKKVGYLNLMESHGFSFDLDELPGSSVVYNVDIIKPSVAIQDNLQCQADDDIYFIKRLRYVEDKIYALEQSYYLKKIVPYLNKEIVEHSIFSYIKDICNVNIGFSDKYFEIIKLDAEIADYLDLAEGDPALVVEEIFYTTSGEPFDFSRVIYHYANTKFSIQASAK